MKWLVKLFAQTHKEEKGGVNLGGIIMLGIGMVFLSVGFIMLPIATDAAATILAYQYSSNAAITDASYTGLTSITGITPLLILLGFLTEAVVAGFLGLKVMREGSGGQMKVNPGNLLLIGLSIVFIGIGLIMFPVALDGISSVYHRWRLPAGRCALNRCSPGWSSRRREPHRLHIHSPPAKAGRLRPR